MHVVLRIFGSSVALLCMQATSLAIEPGPLAGKCLPGERYESAGHGLYGISDACVPITVAQPSTPVEDDDYDPWDYSGIHLEMEEPDQLVTSGLDSGKAYKMTLPPGQSLNLFDKPNGTVIGGLEGGGEVRARYYYTANVNNVWAGVCGPGGVCGWVSADYLFAMPAGRTSHGVYEVMTQEIRAFSEPSFSSKEVGSIYENNRVLVLNIVEINGNHWAEVCRMESCAWTPAFYLSYVY